MRGKHGNGQREEVNKEQPIFTEDEGQPQRREQVALMKIIGKSILFHQETWQQQDRGSQQGTTNDISLIYLYR